MNKRIGLIACLLLLVGALVYLNGGTPRTNQGNQNGQSAPATPAATAPASPPGGVSSPSTTLPAEETVGDPVAAANKITAGWQYDTQNLLHQQALNDALNAITAFARAHKDTSAVVADVDVPAQSRSRPAGAVSGVGVFLNGRPLPGLQGNLGEGTVTAEAISKALADTAH